MASADITVYVIVLRGEGLWKFDQSQLRKKKEREAFYCDHDSLEISKGQITGRKIMKYVNNYDRWEGYQGQCTICSCGRRYWRIQERDY
jgi:hypothetical protein